jgi:hypothetical protein
VLNTTDDGSEGKAADVGGRGRTAVDVVMGAADVMVVCEIGLVVTSLAAAVGGRDDCRARSSSRIIVRSSSLERDGDVGRSVSCVAMVVAAAARDDLVDVPELPRGRPLLRGSMTMIRVANGKLKTEKSESNTQHYTQQR